MEMDDQPIQQRRENDLFDPSTIMPVTNDSILHEDYHGNKLRQPPSGILQEAFLNWDMSDYCLLKSVFHRILGSIDDLDSIFVKMEESTETANSFTESDPILTFLKEKPNFEFVKTHSDLIQDEISKFVIEIKNFIGKIQM